MEVVLLCGGLFLMVIGAGLGRAYERNVWQRRLLERAGMIGPVPQGERSLRCRARTALSRRATSADSRAQPNVTHDAA